MSVSKWKKLLGFINLRGMRCIPKKKLSHPWLLRRHIQTLGSISAGIVIRLLPADDTWACYHHYVWTTMCKPLWCIKRSKERRKGTRRYARRHSHLWQTHLTTRKCMCCCRLLFQTLWFEESPKESKYQVKQTRRKNDKQTRKQVVYAREHHLLVNTLKYRTRSLSYVFKITGLCTSWKHSKFFCPWHLLSLDITRADQRLAFYLLKLQ